MSRWTVAVKSDPASPVSKTHQSGGVDVLTCGPLDPGGIVLVDPRETRKACGFGKRAETVA